MAVLGLVFLSGGIAAVFFTENGPGSASLITLGALVLGVAVFSDRIESIEIGGAKLKLRALARQRFALADQREREGEAKAASKLRRQAHGFERLANAYGRTRRSNPGGPSRTEVLDEIVVQARQLARSTGFDPVDVWSWFDQGDEQARVIALGLMQGDERLRDFFCALDAIEHPRSQFECFHALVVANQMIAGLSKLEAIWLTEAITRTRDGRRFRTDGYSMTLSNEMLAELRQRSTLGGADVDF